MVDGIRLKSPPKAPPVSICSHCGQEHDASLRICPKAGKAIGAAAPSVQKTLFGVPSALFPPAPEPRKDIPPSVVALPAPRPLPPSNQSSALALGKTMFGVAPASPKLPPAAAPPIRLPTEAEARENPDLVISLDLTPPAGTQASARERAAKKAPDTTSTLAPVDLPGGEWSAQAGDGEVPAPPEGTPTDLPPPGKGKPFALPQPKDGAGSGQAKHARNASFADRLTADTRSVFDLFQWTLATYLRKPAPLFLLAALLVLPASILQSCLLAGVARGPDAATLAQRVSTVDFSARKAALAARIQASQARGEIDRQAAAELAALTTVETTQVPLPEEKSGEGGGWLREKLALFIQGLLLFGLAFPVACGMLAIATADLQGGAALPGFGDLWPILLARGELFLISLVPAALLVAAGHALFVLPGLVLSVLFVFVPHVVLFEKRGGRPALSRSIELVRSDAVRVVLAFLSFALLGFAAATLTELLLPTSGSRAVVFLHFLMGDLLSVAILPVPALILARIYLDLRARTGATPERLSRAARV
jgi:hypothetical protein